MIKRGFNHSSPKRVYWRRPLSPRFQAWVVPLTTAISFGLLLAIYGWVNWFEPHLQIHPAHQMSGEAPPSEATDRGPLQRDVSASEVTQNIEFDTEEDFLGFNQSQLKARPNEVLSLTFRNRSKPIYHYQHNWVLVKSGTEQQALAEAMSAGELGGFTPRGPEVLARSRLLKPGDSETLIFRAPSEPGNYPYLCTFPGHGNIEKGMLKVR